MHLCDFSQNSTKKGGGKETGQEDGAIESNGEVKGKKEEDEMCTHTQIQVKQKREKGSFYSISKGCGERGAWRKTTC